MGRIFTAFCNLGSSECTDEYCPIYKSYSTFDNYAKDTSGEIKNNTEVITYRQNLYFSIYNMFISNLILAEGKEYTFVTSA